MRKLHALKTAVKTKKINCAVCEYWSGKTEIVCSRELDYCTYKFNFKNWLSAILNFKIKIKKNL